MRSILLLLTISACASTTGVLDREVAPRTGIQLSLVPSDPDTVRVIPTAIDPRLPSVDRLATRIRYEIGSMVIADLSLCVNPHGNVTDIALARTTGLAEVDSAIIDDIHTWQFAELPGDAQRSASLRTCQRATLAYRVR